MAKLDFEATWYPRIGKDAAEELRRGRKIAIFGITMPLFAGGAGLLIGTGAVDDVIGVVLAAMAVGYFVMFINAQRRVAAAMSGWFGVEIKGIPKMNPKRFDAWCQERGLQQPNKRFTEEQDERRSNPTP
jgi:hypothetical protein